MLVFLASIKTIKISSEFYAVNEEERFRFIPLLFWTLSNCSYLKNLTFSKTFIALTAIETVDFMLC